MFIHLFKYRILKMLRTREELFWTLLFPILLGSFFYFSFASITEKTETFTSIPIAVVAQDNTNANTFKSIISTMDKNITKDDSSLFIVTYADKKAASNLLADKKVDGIILASETLSLEISENGINQTILKSFIDNYLHKQNVIQTVTKEKPDQVSAVVNALLENTHYNKEIPLTEGSLDPILIYFYSLIAMACLFGCQSGLSCADQMKADLSHLGSRRTLAPVHRMKVILADFSATLLVQWLSIVLLICYLNFILKVELGNQFGLILLTSFVGSVIGISFGFFIGSTTVFPSGAKNAIALAITMLSSFCSGLMISDMKNLIEHYAPLLNRINPAALLCDALYSLNIYSTHERYYFNMALLMGFAFTFCIASYLMTRRESYDSL